MSAEQTQPSKKDRTFGYARSIARSVKDSPQSMGFGASAIYSVFESGTGPAITLGVISLGLAARKFFLNRSDLIHFLEAEEKKRGLTESELKKRASTIYDVKPKRGGKIFSYNRRSDKNHALKLLENTTKTLEQYEDNSGKTPKNPNYKEIYIQPAPGRLVQSLHSPYIYFNRRSNGNKEVISLGYYNYKDGAQERQAITWRIRRWPVGPKSLALETYEGEGRAEREAISVSELTELQNSILHKLPQAA